MKLRGFQKRLLDKSYEYLKDNNMHIVAPPGSGKTVLGAEIIKQFDQKTLVLVPSLIVKNQWQQTLSKFYESNQISTDLIHTEKITLSTYQDFYSKKRRDQVVHNWEFIVLDEAHHLKKAWAMELLKLREQKNVKTLSLTATPPYDATLNGWERYLELNGRIDEEISISELIKEDILTPYQDYVYLVPVSTENSKKFEDYLSYHEEISNVLASNQEVTDYLLLQPFLKEPLIHTEFIYNHFALYLSCLSYLVEQEYEFSKEHWMVLGLYKQRKNIQIPPQSKKSLGELYEFLYQKKPELTIFRYLEKHNWLDKEGLRLFPTFQVGEYVENIPLKKEAIQHIVVKEESFLGKELCGVIFLDHIKEKALVNPDDILDLGVTPVFVSLTELVKPETEVVALCGSFVAISEKLLISESSLVELSNLGETISTATDYRKIVLTDKNRHEIVMKMTKLLAEKKINMLVGTVSLLGEGWDCPAINTVILANRSGSFVQTQQLRGRGLRKAEGKKLTNIWHIAPVYTGYKLQEQPELSPILKRLSYIEGLDFSNQVTISSDINRFELPELPNQQNISSRINDNFSRGKERQFFKDQWVDALSRGTRLSMPIFVREAEKELNQTGIAKNSIRKPVRKNFFQRFSWLFFADYRKKIRWENYCQQLDKIVHCVYALLQDEKKLTGKEKLDIEWDQSNFSFCLNTTSHQLEKNFNDILIDIFNEIEEPRYLLQIGKNYFAVPKKYGNNRNEAMKFFRIVQNELPKATLFYTKNPEGRKKLVEAYFMQNNREIVANKIWR